MYVCIYIDINMHMNIKHILISYKASLSCGLGVGGLQDGSLFTVTLASGPLAELWQPILELWGGPWAKAWNQLCRELCAEEAVSGWPLISCP